MSDILNLAQRFQQTLADQASATEQTLQEDFKKHEESIRTALKSSANTIESAIKDQSRQTLKYVLKTWVFCAIAVISLLLLAQAALWWQGTMLTENWQAISQQRKHLAELEKKGSKIKLADCGGRICIPEAKGQSRYTRNSDQRLMFIPEGY